jgi:hypothetical protein
MADGGWQMAASLMATPTQLDLDYSGRLGPSVKLPTAISERGASRAKPPSAIRKCQN